MLSLLEIRVSEAWKLVFSRLSLLPFSISLTTVLQGDYLLLKLSAHQVYEMLFRDQKIL